MEKRKKDEKLVVTCRRCNKSFSVKKNFIKKVCPYCGGAELKLYSRSKGAQALLDEVSGIFR